MKVCLLVWADTFTEYYVGPLRKQGNCLLIGSYLETQQIFSLNILFLTGAFSCEGKF